MERLLTQSCEQQSRLPLGTPNVASIASDQIPDQSDSLLRTARIKFIVRSEEKGRLTIMKF